MPDLRLSGDEKSKDMVSVVVSSFHCWGSRRASALQYLDALRSRRAHGPLIMDVSGLVHIPRPVQDKVGDPQKHILPQIFSNSARFG